MRKLLPILYIALLVGCGNIPSFYDDNESMLAVKVRLHVTNLDCDNLKESDLVNLNQSVSMLSLYSDSKNSTDIGSLIDKMKETWSGLYAKKEPSPTYCNLKKRALDSQSQNIAKAIMGRF